MPVDVLDAEEQPNARTARPADPKVPDTNVVIRNATLFDGTGKPGVKGDTVSNVTKPATLETGAVVRVPLFINEGETIRVDTRTGEIAPGAAGRPSPPAWSACPGGSARRR